MSEGEKTEAPTPRRLQKAREAGDVPMSREAVLLAGFLGGAVAAAIEADPTSARAWFGRALARTGGGSDAAAVAAFADAASVLAWTALPVAAAAAAAAFAAGLLQTGFLLRLEAIGPRFSALSPKRGLSRLFGAEAGFQLGRGFIKLAVFAAVVASVFPAEFADAPALVRTSPGALVPALAHALPRLILPLAGAQALLAGADLLLLRVRHIGKLRMSREDLRTEMRESEGNPETKRRVRTLARQRARRRMMAAVPRAAVVVTNPTHYAVALGYERGERGAPRVLAKGADELAARIRELARAHHIPTVANPPLARALYSVELDTEIPPEHFKAVAEIIAYVWGLETRAKAAAAGGPR